MHNGASRATRLRASASMRTAVFYGAMLDSHSAAALAHRRPAVLAGRLPAVLARLLYATLSNLHMVRPTAVIVTMVDPVANASVADTLETRSADARKRHADGEYGTISLLIVELGIQTQWATEHPSRPVSPRPVRNEGGVDDEVDGGARVSGNNGTKQRGVIKVNGGVDRSQDSGGLSATTQVTAGGIAPTYGYFKFSPDRITVAPLQGRRDLITWRESIEPQLEVAGLKGFADGTVPIPSVDDVGLRGEFRAAHLLTFMVISRMMMVSGTRESLDEDSITSYILQDETMQEAEQPTELFPQANYAAPTKLNQQQGQRRKPNGGGQSTEDVDEKRSTRDKGRGGGGRRWECWICHDPDHLSYECLDRDDNDEDDTKGGHGRSTSRRPRRDAKQRKEKQTSKKTSSTKDVDNSSGKSRGDGEASCSMVGVMEPTVSLAPKAGKDFRAVAAAVQANPMAVLLDSSCSHHLMGTKAIFVDMTPSDGVKHVRGFNGALQPVEGRGTVALQGEARKWVLIPNVLYVQGIQANLLSAGQVKESGVQLKGDGDEMLLVAATGGVLGRARYTGRVLCIDLRPCSTLSQSTEVVALRTIVPATKSTSDQLREARAHRGGEFLGKEFIDFVDGKGIVHDLTCPYTPQQNGMAEREMRTAVESVRTMMLHMGVQHHRWHLALRQAVWVRNCLERSTTPSGTTPYQLLTGKKPDLMLAWVWGCIVQFMVPEQKRGGKLVPKARWGLHLGVSPESKGWEVLDLSDKVVTSVEVIFYEMLSLEVWTVMFGPASGRTQAHPPTDTTTATIPLLAEVDEPADEDVVEILPPSPVLAPPFPVADRPVSTPVSAAGDEGSLEASPVAPASGIVDGRQGAKLVDQDGKPSTTGVQSTGELPKSAGSEQLVEGSKQLVDDLTVDEEGELLAGEESTDSNVVEVPITKPDLRRTSRARRSSERLSFHAYLPPAPFIAVYDEVDGDLLYDDAEEDDELPELDPDMHAVPEHRWDIATMTVKEALASWKGEAVKAAMEEEIRNLVGMGTWELVKRPRGVNIMKNRWVLTAKYRLDDTVEREKARLVVKGSTQVCGADYDKTYSPNAFLQSKLDRVLYMYQPDYFDDGTGRVCKLLKSLYELKQSPLLWYRALDGVLLGVGWKKSQVDKALYFKASDNGLREILPVVKYLGLEIVCDRPARKLLLHQQGYTDKLRRRFIDKEQGGRVPKAPVLVDAYAELTVDDEEAQEREEEEYRQKFGSLQIAATTSRPDIAFACSKLRSGLTVRSDQHWREVDRCLAYLADTRDTALEFGGGPESLELIGYVDADDARDKQKRTSMSSYVFEYVATTNAGKEGRRLRFLLAEFKLLDAGKPTILRVDNNSAITVAAGLGLTGNLKHMERRFAWLQHMVRRRKFVLKYILATEQPADFLTKALHFPAFSRCSVAIGQVHLADVGDGDDDVQQ
ncbi:unnamed protein product [Closterium sp. NIES-54]